MKFLPLLILSLLILTFCKPESKETSVTEIASPYMVDLAGAKNDERKLFLSDYASNISYISLETEGAPLIERVWDLKYDGEILALVNFSNNNENRNILLYDKNGKFQRIIGKHGRGPGEYFLPYGVELFPEASTIIVDDNTGWLFSYDYSGTFIKKKKIDYFSTPIKKISDSTFILFKTFEYSDEGSDLITIYNYDLDTIKTLVDRSQYIGKRSLLQIMSSEYSIDNNTYFWDNISDTTFMLTADLNILPDHYFVLGKNALPHKLRFSGEYLEFQKYENVSSSIGTTNNIFHRVWHQYKQHYYIYNIADSITVKVGNSDDIPFNGLENDIDGGVSFFPIQQLSDNIYYTILYPSKLLKLKDEFISRAKDKNISTNNRFFSLLEGLNENDNPVLMLVEMK